MAQVVTTSELSRGTFYFDIMQMTRRKGTVTRKELTQTLTALYRPTPALTSERSTGGNVFESHLSWDLHALRDLQLIKLNKRGSYSITDKGRKVVSAWMSNDGALRRTKRDSLIKTVSMWVSNPCANI